MSGAFGADAGAERLGWAGILGVLVTPLLVGVLLVWALGAPREHLDRVTAAIVNEDVPVTIDGQTVPLGRQFAAGLIDGGQAEPAVAAPASGAPGSTATPTSTPTPAAPPPPAPSAADFTWVLTNGDEAADGLASGRYAAVVTIPASFSAAATSMTGPAAQARRAQLEVATTPASAALDPALTRAVTQAAVASLNQQLIAQYLGGVYQGFTTINEQIGEAADGADSLASGADSLVSGAGSLAGGAAELATGLDALDTGTEALAAGLSELSAASAGLPRDAAALAAGSTAVSDALAEASAALDGATGAFADVVANVCARPGRACDAATSALGRLQDADGKLGRLSGAAGEVAAGNDALAAAMPPLVGGIDASADGAEAVAGGASGAAEGGASLSSGAAQLASGASQVDAGAAQLATGLAQAVEQIPTYSADDIETLSDVVSQPVGADQDVSGPGLRSVPLFAAIALWIGGMALALARRAVPTRRLLTSAPTRLLAVEALRPTALLGAGQGLLVAVALLFALPVTPIEWLAFTGCAVLVGAVLAWANQALAAALGAVGRLVAVAVAVVGLAAGLTSTVPAAVAGLAASLPTAPATSALSGALTGGAGVWPALGVLLLVAVLAAGIELGAIVARRR